MTSNRFVYIARVNAALRRMVVVCFVVVGSTNFVAAQELPDYEHAVFDIRSVMSGTSRETNRSQFNGLPSRGIPWFTAEALFSSFNVSDALIGAPNAPAAFQQFERVTAKALEGDRFGPSSLDSGAIGEQVEDDKVTGMRFSGGIRLANDGGLFVDYFDSGDFSRSYSRGLGGLDAGADFTTVRVTNALPLNNGGNGYAVPFDQWFRLGLDTSLSGGSVNVAPLGLWWGPALIQPTIGATTLQMDESFGFEGADSGLSFQLDSTGVPTEGQTPVVSYLPYQALLMSSLETEGSGGQIGLSYRTTGKRFRFGGVTRFGLMSMETKMNLSGRGIGNGFAAGFDPTVVFEDDDADSYRSLLFDQKLFVDVQLDRTFKLIRALPGASYLSLRLSWSVTGLFDVYRATDIIEWDGAPLVPTIRRSRENVVLQSLSLGLIWAR